MKVIHILSSGTYSGAEKVAIEIIENTKSHLDVYYASPSGEIEIILKEQKINYIKMKEFTLTEVKKIIKENKPEIIHAHDFRATVYSSLGKQNNSLIAHIHNNNVWLKRINLNSILYLYATRKVDRIINVSDSIANEYIFSSFISKKSETVPNIIDNNQIIEQSKLGTSNDKYNLIFLGRLAIEKAPEKFINIVKELSLIYPNIKACIVGKGPLEDKCKKMVAELNLNKNIDFIGYQKNPYPFIKNSEILVVPSEWEGFGLAAIEGLSLGKPVVAANVGGLPEIISEEVGEVCNNTKEFIDSIKKLLNNPILYQQKSENALILSKKFTDKKNYRNRILSIYESVNKSNL